MNNYAAMQSLITAILLAGNLANPATANRTFEIPALAECAKEILETCGYDEFCETRRR